MTGLLDEVLHEKADALGAPQLDLERIISDGDRRRWRGRLVGTAAAASVVAVAASGALLVTGSDDDRSPVASVSAAGEISYAKDDRIHVGDDVVDTGETVWSYVLTDSGPVWTTRAGDVVTEQDGEPVTLGRTSTEGHSLRADGPLVAWVEFPEGAPAEFVVYDTSERAEVLRSTDGTVPGMDAYPTGAEGEPGAFVYAVDGTSVYWHSVDGIVRHDLESGVFDVLAPPGAFSISDVADGTMAYEAGPEGSSSLREKGVLVGRSFEDGVRTGRHGTAYLSPGGSFVSFEDADEMFVIDTETGADVTPEVTGFPFHVVTQWLDDDTAVVFGLRSTDDEGAVEIGLLECDIPSGDCTEQTSDTVTYGEFQLPVGQHIGD